MPMSQKRKEFLIKEISRLHRKGLSNVQISLELDCSQGFVSDHTRPCDLKYKIEKQARGIIKKLNKFDDLLKSGSTVKNAIKSVKSDRQTLKKWRGWYDAGGFDEVVNQLMSTYTRTRKPSKERGTEQISEEYAENMNVWNALLYRPAPKCAFGKRV